MEIENEIINYHTVNNLISFRYFVFRFINILHGNCAYQTQLIHFYCKSHTFNSIFHFLIGTFVISHFQCSFKQSKLQKKVKIIESKKWWLASVKSKNTLLSPLLSSPLPPPTLDIPKAFHLRLAPYSGEVDMKRGTLGQVFDY